MPLRAALVVVALLVPAVAAAQSGAYEIQVYPSAVVPARQTMVEFHSNFTPRGVQAPTDATQPTDRAFHETLEITHGFSDWFEVGFYLFTSARGGDGWRFVGSHIRPRISIPASWHWPVGVSVSQEFGFVERYFSPDRWDWEIRPIIDQRRGRLYWSVNPALERALSGPGPKPFKFAPAVKISYDVTRTVAAGLEYYADVGRVVHFDPVAKEQHQIFPTIDLDLSPNFEFNAGVGIGLTNVGDRLILKVIVGYRLGR